MSQQIIDVGANEGHWSLFMRHLHPKSPILAIEPNPVPLELLQKNFAANHLSNATVLAIALAGKAEIREFETIDNVTGLGSFHIDRTGRPWLTPEKIKLIEVECRTLDQILQQQNLTPFIDILKVDVEGAELDVVRGAQLALQRVRRIQIEYGTESNRENLVRKLSDQGFKLLLDHKFSPGRGDLFFLSRALI